MIELIDSTALVKELFTHPVKGLTPQKCDRVFLQAEHGIPGDRAFALMYQSVVTDVPDTDVPWMQKKNFAMQCDLPVLAALNCQYDSSSNILTVKQGDRELLSAATNTSAGRDRLSSFFSEYIALHRPQKGSLRLVGDPGGQTRYSDRQPVHISLVSQATLDALSSAAGQEIDARRFRPNIVLEGVPAWEEFNWVGQELQIGQARIKISAQITRCLNIDVNPDTGEQDIELFSLLKQHFHHKETGVVAQVISSGDVALQEIVVMGDLAIG
jgi:uncharacterized protein